MANIRCMGCMEEFDDSMETCPHCGYKRGTPAKEAFHMQPESILHGRYIIGKVLGFGGFGITYLAWDFVLDKKVAIKEYLPSDFATRMPNQTQVSVFAGEKKEQFDAGLKSFIEESQRLAKFNNIDGIVSIFNSFVENNTAYIVMEYLEGETLKDLLKRKGKISYQEAIKYMLPVLYALEKVHKEGIIHRDIAPDNIFITKSNQVKLLDFGAARYATTVHSKSLSVILKPGYAPEEQYRTKGNQGPWTDVYASCATIYRAITGFVPEDSLERNANDKLKEPSKLGVKLPESVQNALMNGLNVKAEDRIQSTHELADALSGEIEMERIVVIQKKEDVGKWPIWLKGLLGGAVAVLILFISLVATGTVETPMVAVERVPSIVGMNTVDAKQEVEKVKMGYQIQGNKASSEVEENLVLIQNPNAGKSVNKATNPDVYVVISSGVQIIEVPNLVGYEESKAVGTLEGLGFEVEIKTAPSMYAKGTVAKQSDANKKIDTGTTIVLTISEGVSGRQKDVTVPSVVGKTQAKAQKILEKSKLFTKVTGSKYSNKIPKGCVISQSPVAKTNAKTYSTVVNIVISLGKKGNTQVVVPYVIGEEESNAKNALSSLTCKVVRKSSETVAAGYVVSQSIKAGEKVIGGSDIEIAVSTGRKNQTVAQKKQAQEMETTATTTKKQSSSKTTKKAKTTKKIVTTNDTRVKVPNVVGLSQSNADSKLKSVGVTPASEKVYSSSVTIGSVISQSVSAGTKVNGGTVITLKISAGNANDAWSSWNEAKHDSSYDIEQKTQYGYQTRTKSTSTVWSDWSSWSDTAQSASSTKQVETRTLHLYYHYAKGRISDYSVTSEDVWWKISNNTGITNYHAVWKVSAPDTGHNDTTGGGSHRMYGGSGHSCPSCGYSYWYMKSDTKKQYRYKTSSQETNYSNWSSTSWSDSSLSTSDTKRYYGSRVLYKYREDLPIYD